MDLISIRNFLTLVNFVYFLRLNRCILHTVILAEPVERV